MVLAGVVTAADPRGRSYPDYVEEEIFAPLGLENCSIGFSPARRAKLEEAGLIAPLYLRTKKPWNILPEESKPQRVNYPCPAGNGRGPAKELCAIYASLLPVAASAENATPRLLRPETVEQLTAVARRGLFDELQGVDTDWSLGFAVNCILSGRHASQTRHMAMGARKVPGPSRIRSTSSAWRASATVRSARRSTRTLALPTPQRGPSPCPEVLGPSEGRRPGSRTPGRDDDTLCIEGAGAAGQMIFDLASGLALKNEMRTSEPTKSPLKKAHGRSRPRCSKDCEIHVPSCP